MTTDTPETSGVDDDREAESALLRGLVTAISDHGGPLDQSAVDEALGVSPSVDTDLSNDAPGPTH